MTLVALDLNATRVRAATGTAATEPRPLALDGKQPELPMALSLEGRHPALGRAGTVLCRRSPHLACLCFLPYLGQRQEWVGPRLTVDADRAVALVFEHVAGLCGKHQVVAAAVPGYQFGGGELLGTYDRNTPKSYEVSLVNEMDRSLILTSFRFDGAPFNPPGDCGWPRTGRAPAPVPCTEVGETPGDVKVYVGTEAASKQTAYYAHVGRSVVTLRDANTFAPITQDLAMHIFGSLRKTSADRLRELSRQAR